MTLITETAPLQAAAPTPEHAEDEGLRVWMDQIGARVVDYQLRYAGYTPAQIETFSDASQLDSALEGAKANGRYLTPNSLVLSFAVRDVQSAAEKPDELSVAAYGCLLPGLFKAVNERLKQTGQLTKGDLVLESAAKLEKPPLVLRAVAHLLLSEKRKQLWSSVLD